MELRLKLGFCLRTTTGAYSLVIVTNSEFHGSYQVAMSCFESAVDIFCGNRHVTAPPSPVDRLFAFEVQSSGTYTFDACQNARGPNLRVVSDTMLEVVHNLRGVRCHIDAVLEAGWYILIAEASTSSVDISFGCPDSG